MLPDPGTVARGEQVEENTMTDTHADAQIDITATLVEALREESPLVQCLTNTVTQNFTANVLLASGATVAMVDVEGEAGLFSGIADATLVNLGTINGDQIVGMREAVSALTESGGIWVLDPIGVGGLPVRSALAFEFLDRGPTVIRGNASEIIGLAGGTGGKGVDSAQSVDAAAESARYLAAKTGGVVAVSGEVDLIVDAESTIRAANGSDLLTKVTGGGCALGAYLGAFVSVGVDRGVGMLESVAAGASAYTVAADIAAENSHGPGTFSPQFLDALYSMTADDIRKRAQFR